MLLATYLQLNGQGPQADPHRPVCTSVGCRTAKLFVKKHYCGAPEGNGPDDSCDIRLPKKRTNIRVLADFSCEWIDGAQKCQQRGQPSPELRVLLTNALRDLGLSVKARGQIYFTVWQSAGLNWSLVEANYDHIVGEENEQLCQIIGIVDQNSELKVLKKVRFQKVDADKNNVTTWSPVDLADVNGDGQIEIILEGDAYEDHWVEVDQMKDGYFSRVFSGLGYYL